MYREWKSFTDINQYNGRRINFKTYEKIIKKNIENAKHIFHHNVFKSCKTDMKKIWGIINETLNRNTNKNDLPTEFLVNDHCISNSKIIADSFNTYFMNIGSNLSSTLNLRDHSLSFNNYLTSRTESRFNYSTISVEKVLSIINNLGNKNSSGYDDISNKLLKSIKEEVCTPLTVIINKSVLNGIFPSALKIAIVKPLFKKGENNCFNNYISISFLPTISIFFECAIYFQLYNYFNKLIYWKNNSMVLGLNILQSWQQ